MSPVLTWIVLAAMLGLAVLFVTWYRSNRQLGPLIFQLAGLLMVAVFLRMLFRFPQLATGPSPRGVTEPGGSLLIVLLLFAAMLLGMLAHWLYGWLEAPRAERRPFDLGLFLAPVLASPIVFIPLMASLQTADLDLSRMDVPRLMLFFVAFENGFFWKEYFEGRRRKAAAA